MLDNYLFYTESTPTDATSTDSILIFDSGDSNTYTVSAEADSSAQQTVLILYDIRNILLILIFCWFIVSLYYRLKNTISSYFR